MLNPSNEANVVNANMYKYLEGRAKKDCQATFGQSTGYNTGRGRRSGLPDNPKILYSRPEADGTQITQDDNPTITRRSLDYVDWWKVDKFGRMDKFPLLVMGDYTLELNFDNQKDPVAPAWLGLGEIQKCDDIDINDGTQNFGRSVPLVLTRTENNQWFAPAGGMQIEVAFRSSTGPTTTGWQSAVIDSVAIIGDQYEITLTEDLTSAGVDDTVDQIYVCYHNYNTDTYLGLL